MTTKSIATARSRAAKRRLKRAKARLKAARKSVKVARRAFKRARKRANATQTASKRTVRRVKAKTATRVRRSRDVQAKQPKRRRKSGSASSRVNATIKRPAALSGVRRRTKVKSKRASMPVRATAVFGRRTGACKTRGDRYTFACNDRIGCRVVPPPTLPKPTV